MIEHTANALDILSEDELVARARTGCPDAFTELMRRNSNATKKLAASVLRDVNEAEDAMQDAWSKAWQHVANFHGESKFSTWFTRIVLNQCLMRLRSARRRPVVQLEEASPDNDRPAMQVVEQGPNPEALFASVEMRDLVRLEVSKMPPLLRDPLVLRDLDQLPIEKVATLLRVSVPAVKSRLLRARTELRQRLEPHLGREAKPVAATR
jgi:RNA polymerase sigma-70 factor, ECF subfamily